MKNTVTRIKDAAQKVAFTALATIVTNTKKATFVATASILSAAVIAAPDADTVNTQASTINAFIEDILNGDIGYLLTLVAFFGGLGIAITKREWMPAFYGFVIAVLILLVPDAMRGLFSGLSTA